MNVNLSVIILNDWKRLTELMHFFSHQSEWMKMNECKSFIHRSEWMKMNECKSLSHHSEWMIMNECKSFSHVSEWLNTSKWMNVNRLFIILNEWLFVGIPTSLFNKQEAPHFRIQAVHYWLYTKLSPFIGRSKT